MGARKRDQPGCHVTLSVRWTLLLALLLCAGGVRAHGRDDHDRDTDPCYLSAGQHFCGKCTQQEGCFWCENTRSCRNTSVIAQCADSQVIKEPSKCPTCANEIDCVSCATSPVGDCGWCTSAFSCVSSKLLANGSACPDSDYFTVDAACPVNPLVDQAPKLPSDWLFVASDNSYAIEDVVTQPEVARVLTLFIPNTEYKLRVNLGIEAGKCGGVGCRIMITGSDSNPFCICFGVALPPNGSEPQIIATMLPRLNPTQDTRKGVELLLSDFCRGGAPAVLQIMCRPPLFAGQAPQIAVDEAFLFRPPICGASHQPSRFVMELYGSAGCRRYLLYPPSGTVSIQPEVVTVGQPRQEVLVTLFIQTNSRDPNIANAPWIHEDERKLELSVICNGQPLDAASITGFYLADNKFQASFFIEPTQEGTCLINVNVAGPYFWAKVSGHTNLTGDPSAVLILKTSDSIDWWKYSTVLFVFVSLVFASIAVWFFVKYSRKGKVQRELCLASAKSYFCNKLAPPPGHSPNEWDINTAGRPPNETVSREMNCLPSDHPTSVERLWSGPIIDPPELSDCSPSPHLQQNRKYFGFLCFHGSDRDHFMAPLHLMLEQLVPDCPFFYDKRCSVSNRDPSIADALHSCKIAVVLITRHWFTNRHGYPFEELATLLGRYRNRPGQVLVVPLLYGLTLECPELKGSGLQHMVPIMAHFREGALEFIPRAVAHLLVCIEDLLSPQNFSRNYDREVVKLGQDLSTIVNSLGLRNLYERCLHPETLASPSTSPGPFMSVPNTAPTPSPSPLELETKVSPAHSTPSPSPAPTHALNHDRMLSPNSVTAEAVWISSAPLRLEHSLGMANQSMDASSTWLSPSPSTAADNSRIPSDLGQLGNPRLSRFS